MIQNKPLNKQKLNLDPGVGQFYTFNTNSDLSLSLLCVFLDTIVYDTSFQGYLVDLYALTSITKYLNPMQSINTMQSR